MPSIITYCRPIVAIDLYLVVFDIFDFENTVTLKSGSGVTQKVKRISQFVVQ